MLPYNSEEQSDVVQDENRIENVLCEQAVIDKIEEGAENCSIPIQFDDNDVDVTTILVMIAYVLLTKLIRIPYDIYNLPGMPYPNGILNDVKERLASKLMVCSGIWFLEKHIHADSS